MLDNPSSFGPPVSCGTFNVDQKCNGVMSIRVWKLLIRVSVGLMRYILSTFPSFVVMVGSHLWPVRAIPVLVIGWRRCVVLRNIFKGKWRVSQSYSRNTPSHVSIPPYQNSTMAKDAWWVRKVHWRRERAPDKTGKRVVVFVVCTAGAFIGCVDNVKSD